MDELTAIKKRLKIWEGEFQKQNDRKPNKDDICSAPEDIRGAYKEYGILRKRLQKLPVASVDGVSYKEEHSGSAVWGSHLNKSNSVNKGSEWLANDKATSKDTEIQNCEEENKPTFTASLREKLLEKALSTSDKKVSYSKSGFSRSKSSVFGANRTCQSETMLKSLNDQQTMQNVFSNQSFNQEKSEGDQGESDEVEIKSSIFVKGLKATKKATLKRTVSDEDSKVDSFMTVLQQRKSSKFKLQNKYANYSLKSLDTVDFESSEKLNSTSFVSDTANDEKDNLKNKESSNNRPFGMFSSSKSLYDNSTSAINPHPFHTNSHLAEGDDTTSCVQKDTVFKEQSKLITNSININTFSSNSDQKASLKQSEQAKSKFNNLLSVSNETEPKRGRKRQISETSASVSTPKRRNVVALKSPVTPVNEDSNSMMVEVSWRPNSRQDNNLMIDLDSSIQDTVSDEPKSDDDSETVKKPKKYAKARSTAPKMSNDNYIRLNMKAKKYQRKGKITSGPAYKRMQWKLKMKARSESFGSGKCFKCGQEGHWANKCKGGTAGKSIQKTSIEPVTDNPVDDADFPTMSQAFNMARGIKGKPLSKNARVETTSEIPDNVDNSDDVDIEEEPDVIRTAYEPTPPPPPIEPLYCLADKKTLPGDVKSVVACRT